MKIAYLLRRLSLYVAAILLIGFSGKVFATEQHPAYLQALSDLRTARWMIDHHPGAWKATKEETLAIKLIDQAIDQIKKAAIDDGKPLMAHAKTNEPNMQAARLHSAYDFLNKAKDDVSKDEDAAFGDGLKMKVTKTINEAISVTKWRVNHM